MHFEQHNEIFQFRVPRDVLLRVRKLKCSTISGLPICKSRDNVHVVFAFVINPSFVCLIESFFSVSCKMKDPLVRLFVNLLLLCLITLHESSEGLAKMTDTTGMQMFCC